MKVRILVAAMAVALTGSAPAAEQFDVPQATLMSQAAGLLIDELAPETQLARPNDAVRVLGFNFLAQMAGTGTTPSDREAARLAANLRAGSKERAFEVLVALADMAAATRPGEQSYTNGEPMAAAVQRHLAARTIEVQHAWRVFSVLEKRFPTRATYTRDEYLAAFVTALADVDVTTLTEARLRSESNDGPVAHGVEFEGATSTWRAADVLVRETPCGDRVAVSVESTDPEITNFRNQPVRLHI